ncbi:apolipoprotein L6-like isoform X2 [Eulemur rufifrons]|uniref:apolipoprotein L6-like isoform X2 n=1 Tax=Eulemur rufifrons TaxID=859984 RepID=UPI003743F2D2
MDLASHCTGDKKEDIPLSEDEEPEDHLSAEEKIFLREFPRLKQDLEANIKKLYALAEDVDKRHKAFTKTSLVANSVAVVSGVVSILGLVLAPVTGGGSLLLSTAGQTLGAAAGVTSIVTDQLERSHKKKAQAQVSNLVASEDEAEKEIYISAASSIICNVARTVDNVKKSLRAFQKAKAQPRLAKAANRLMTTGHISARRSRQVQKAFGGTALAMTKSARMVGGALASLSLGLDLAAASRDWKHLKEGATTELADELRAQASELETKLKELTEQYERLQPWQ